MAVYHALCPSPHAGPESWRFTISSSPGYHLIRWSYSLYCVSDHHHCNLPVFKVSEAMFPGLPSQYIPVYTSGSSVALYMDSCWSNSALHLLGFTSRSLWQVMCPPSVNCVRQSLLSFTTSSWCSLDGLLPSQSTSIGSWSQSWAQRSGTIH